MSVNGDMGPDDLWLFNEGTERYAHRVLGAHWAVERTRFGVWAPNASKVSVVGDFNSWSDDAAASSLHPVGDSGVWSGHIDGVRRGDRYKYRVFDRYGRVADRADPYALRAETPPATASIVDTVDYVWSDSEWMAQRGSLSSPVAPVSIYEVHLGSWGRTVSPQGRFPTYTELAHALVDHVSAHGFTHVELMPIMAHPFYGSWGYQTTSYFAPSGIYGTPTELMEMVDVLHANGVGVILDWVPSHFPTDDFALANFDGTALYEYADPREGFHPDWNSAIFNYSRHEVRSFLVSSAISWLERYHADGLRVDAVASMLYRDYSRPADAWIPNVDGGRENLEAIAFIRALNTAIAEEFPDVVTFAEESTAFPGVTTAVTEGGLGFTYKWDMGWMHDTLGYFRNDPVHRRWHQGELSFRSVYAFTENFVLPLSHDEVVHAKGSLLDQMPGDRWQKFANLRLLYGYQWTQPGKKLLFMGSELAPEGDWSHEAVLDWSLHDMAPNAGVRAWVRDLNHLYRSEPALFSGDCDPAGFEWIAADDAENSVFVYRRRVPPVAATSGSSSGSSDIIVVMNATPIPRSGYRVGVPTAGSWRTVLNSDSTEYGGSGWLDVRFDGEATITSDRVAMHGHPDSVALELPPLSVIMVKLR